jgi:hypothetical protein
MHCSCCNHPNRDQLDHQLVSGASYRLIRSTFHVSLGAISRHKVHVKEMIQARTADERREHASDLLGRVQKLADEAIGLLESAKAAGNIKGATAAVCAAVRCLELLGRLDGQLRSANTPGISFNTRINVNITNFDSDEEFAAMIGEATRGFSIDELMRLKRIAESQKALPACNDLAPAR